MFCLVNPVLVRVTAWSQFAASRRSRLAPWPEAPVNPEASGVQATRSVEPTSATSTSSLARVRMIRVGSRTDFDPRATVRRAFAYLVGDDAEDWHGIAVFHNPRAKHPMLLDFDGFGCPYQEVNRP